jgi:hypothetical protein
MIPIALSPSLSGAAYAPRSVSEDCVDDDFSKSRRVAFFITAQNIRSVQDFELRPLNVDRRGR